jgi:cation transport ATPase
MIGDMSTARIRHALAPNTAVVMLVLTVSGLSAGLVLHAAGASQAGNGAWLATGLLGAGYGLWAVSEALLRRRMGVDVIALLAVSGAIAVGELLAAAVIAVMLASGRALEA